MATVRYTVMDGEIIAEKRDGVRRSYVPDDIGSTVALLDSTQAQTDTFTYWPFGEEKSRTGTTETPFRFAGTQGYYQDTSVLKYVRVRELSAPLGKWLTPDPLRLAGGDVNLYRYVWDGPTSRSDPSGLLGAIYGEYCGPQSGAGTGPEVDALDKCCKAHDECFAANRPPCHVGNQLVQGGCIRCNDQLCYCAAMAPCSGLICFLFKNLLVLEYSCLTSVFHFVSSPKDPFGGLPKACPINRFPAY